jgi:O-antigen ligase/tetratricopeptide (TPR) repeat protein
LLGVKVALVPVIFDASMDMPFVVSKAILSHGLSYLLAAILIGLVIWFGADFVVRSWLHAPVLAFLLVSGAASALAVNPFLALFGTHARMLGMASVLDFVVLYFAIVLLVRSRADAIAIAVAAFAGSCAVLAYEAVQILGRDPYRWNIDSVQRPFSSLGEATALAQYLTVLAMGALTLGLFIERIRLSLRVALLTYSAMLLLGAAATGTRSALVGLAAGCAVLVLLVWNGHPSRWARVISLIGAATALAAVAALLLFSPLGARLAATIDAGAVDNEEVLARLEPSASGRIALYGIGLGIVRERPLLGYGPDNFVVGVPRYRPEQAPDLVRQGLASSAHSWAVQVATSSGVVGLLCFVAIPLVALALAFRAGFRPGAIAGAAMIAAFLGTGLTTVNEFGTEWLFWTSAAAIAASTAGDPMTKVSRREGKAKRTKAYWNSSTRRIVGAVLLAVAVLLAINGSAALQASRWARASEESRLVGDSSRAVELALAATRADPGRAEYWHALGLAHVAAAQWRDSVSAFDRASKLAPYDSSYVSDLVTAEMILALPGDSAARTVIRELGDKTVRVDPNNPRAHITRAIVMQFLGDLPQAVISIERALDLDPKSTNEVLYATATQLMLLSGRPADAVRLARDGLAIAQTDRAIAIRIDLARGLYALGKREEALGQLAVVLEVQPDNVTAQQLRAEILRNPSG